MVTRALATLVLCATAACTGGERRLLSAGDTSSSETGVERGAEPASPPSRPEPEPLASESEARAVLAERFREAGFRVRYDVTLLIGGDFEMTVDGYDPGSKVGFEYVAAEERDTDLSVDERAALGRLSEYRILIVDPAPLGLVTDQADQFLAAARSQAGPDR